MQARAALEKVIQKSTDLKQPEIYLRGRRYLIEVRPLPLLTTKTDFPGSATKRQLVVLNAAQLASVGLKPAKMELQKPCQVHGGVRQQLLYLSHKSGVELGKSKREGARAKEERAPKVKAKAQAAQEKAKSKPATPPG